jgi:hypothetical protein
MHSGKFHANQLFSNKSILYTCINAKVSHIKLDNYKKKKKKTKREGQKKEEKVLHERQRQFQ